MGVVIYVTGEGTIVPKNGVDQTDLTEEQVDDIRNIKNGWIYPALDVQESSFSFSDSMMEGCDPYDDGVIKPLKSLITYAKANSLSVSGNFEVTSDWRDYDDITITISDNEISYANSEVMNASTEELELELASRKPKPTTLYDVVLIEKPGEDGLTKTNVMDLYDMLNGEEAYPLEIGDRNGSSTAMGFISAPAAESLQYEYDQNSGLASYISLILDDIGKESEDCSYEYQGLSIWLSRD